ncbi:hypothetical protein C8Q78DRAFT_1071889 [Trametes maxima]|nr:hypothetical protein C8Q78DRAFT_1071889 [Trametes maxima]
MRDDRSVTPPPPQDPSPEYLAQAEQAPSRIEDPSALKKLLVLDLNGTLVHRSPHVPRARARYPQTKDDRSRDSYGGWLPRLRPVHPRPYMCAFRSYLFSPQTRQWLDVMVWSSAQPHSVDDMVGKCFGEEKDKLFAVWARDTLGLSNDNYHRKVQTVKDLAKPWSLLGFSTTHTPSSPHSSIASTPRTSPEPSSPSRPSDESIQPIPQAHSALTTLLLDDSPRKAELQPFNHVCIGEYSGERRAKDLDSLQTEQEWDSAVEARQLLDAQMGEAEGLSDAATTTGAEPAPDPAHEGVNEDSAAATDSSKKRKRKEKKLQKRAALLEQLQAGGKPEVSYDETLLAVIGVLDEIKSQANVAAWIRSGGLWGPYGLPTARRAVMRAEDEPSDDRHPKSGSSAEVERAETGAQSDSSDLSVGKAPSSVVATTTIVQDDNKPRKRKKKRPRTHASDEVADAGNDEETIASAPPPEVQTNSAAEEVPQGMWFEDRQVLDYWADRGRKALESLGISVEHGIER